MSGVAGVAWRVGAMTGAGVIRHACATWRAVGECGVWAQRRRRCRGNAGLKDATPYRLVIADDHPLFRGALREAVSGLFDHADIAEAGSFDEIGQLLDRGADVDLILLDLAMPGVRGFSGLMYLRAQYPSGPRVVVSANDDPAVIRRCMDFGASGFIPKTLGVEAMRAAIANVLAGEGWMPPDVDL